MHRLCFPGHQLNSGDHLVCLQVHHLVLRLARLPLRLQIRHQRLLDEDHRNHRDDLHSDAVHLDHRNRLDDPVHLDEVHQNRRDDHRWDDHRRDDLRRDDPVHLDERQLDEVRRLRHRLVEDQRFQMKMDYCQRAEAAVLK